MVRWPLMAVAMALLLAPATVGGTAAATRDFQPSWALDRWYNPSFVEHGDRFYSAAKLTNFKRVRSKTWWINSLFMCEGAKEDVDGLAGSVTCRPFDPWPDEFRECEMDKRVRNGKLDNSGLGDVKMWTWPGRGVYAIFGRKPERNSTDAFCSGFIVYHQWLAMVKPDPKLSASDPWNLHTPLPLLPHRNHSYPATSTYAMEKNWMPFVYTDPATKQEHLFVTYYVQPHIVFELQPSGEALHRWTTHNESLFAKFKGYSVHGGPPVVHVPASRSSTGRAYYMGIMHHIERFDNGRIRLYRHFAFRFDASPPFAINAISDELPLVFNQTHKSRTYWVAFVSGLYLTADDKVYISYGAADVNARLLVMPLRELEGLFSGEVRFRDVSVPYERVPEEAALHRALHNQRTVEGVHHAP